MKPARSLSLVTVQFKNSQQGFTIVEAILSATIFAMLATACLGTFFYGQALARDAGQKMKASFLATEGLEAVRSIRDTTDALPLDGVYGLDTTSDTWQLIETSDTPFADMTREILVETVDDYTKKIAVTISWTSGNHDKTFILATYLTLWTASIEYAPL